MRKSILYLAVYDPHVPLTGTGARGAEFVNNLAKRFDIDLVYMDGSGHPSDAQLSMQYSSRVKGVRTKTCVNFSKFGYFIFSKALYKKARVLLKNNKYDCILCDYGLSAIYGCLLSKEFHIPFIYGSHNIEFKAYLDKVKKDKRRLFLVPYVYAVERLGVSLSKILIAITSGDGEYYLRWANNNKMLIIPQGFDELVFNPFYEPAKKETKIVLFAGNYNNQFNREVISVVKERILDDVIKKCPNTIFRFVGANPPQDIEHPKIEFTGFVRDYPAYLKEADVIISPMQQGRGSPTKIFEALACGKPIIATPTGARSLERDYESLHICEIEQFPEMICKMLQLDEPLTDVDFEKVQNRYSWENNIQRLADKIEAEI